MKRNYIFILIFFYTLTGQSQNPYFEIGKQMEIYNDVLKHLATNYIDELNFGDLIQKNTRHLLNGLDRFTTYYDEQGILDQKMRQEGHFSGIGISMQYKDSLLLVTRVYKDTPASKTLKVGDKILEIEGKKVADLERKVAVNILKGAKGTKVKVKLERNGKRIEKEIERQDIPLDAVTITQLDGDIGYIRFVKFNKKASAQVKMAILDLKKQGAQKLIIDERGNPGGLLNEVVKIVNFFIPKGKVVVTTKGRFEKYNRTYATKNESMDEEIPIVILVNNHSASASEILSGSLQDYDRAVIIGDTTYGKGLVQRTFKLTYGTYMKQTISKYYIPSGRLIQKIDYWHRDKNGKPLLMSANAEEKDYKTTNGRIVHNLGGVIPDIVIAEKNQESILSDLKSKGYLFDFATWYYYQHPAPENIESFKLTDKDFEDFIHYLQQNDTYPKSQAQLWVEKAYKKAENEGQSQDVLQAYNRLLDQYNQANLEVLRKHKSYIIEQLYKDLTYRYFYLEGYTEYMLQNDKVIQKAKEVLNHPSEYNKILGR